MCGYRAWMVLGAVVLSGLAADVSEAALAKAAGGSGFSGTLSSNKAIRKQQLIADPNSPTSGSASVLYNPSIVSIDSLSFGPGYTGFGLVEVQGSEGPQLINFSDFNSESGPQTGYAQVFFFEPEVTTSAVLPLHGQITPPAGYVTVDNDGPAAVDTHALLFSYLPGVPDTTVAQYTVYADDGSRGSSPDFMNGVDDQGQRFRVEAGDIAPAFVRGSLVAVPFPPAMLAGGVTMLGYYGVRRLRRRK